MSRRVELLVDRLGHSIEEVQDKSDEVFHHGWVCLPGSIRMSIEDCIGWPIHFRKVEEELWLTFEVVDGYPEGYALTVSLDAGQKWHVAIMGTKNADGSLHSISDFSLHKGEK